MSQLCVSHNSIKSFCIAKLIHDFETLCVIVFADVDECTAQVDDCDDNAACQNSKGSFTCTCNSGYFGNGSSCLGICNLFTKTHIFCVML